MQEVRAQNPQIEQAIAEIRRGERDERNFRLIFNSYYRPLHNFFRRKTFSPEEADDLTQETFLRVFNKIEQFRADAPFEAWLWQIAANLYRKRIASRLTHKRSGETVSMDEETVDGAELQFQDKSDVTPLDAVLQAEQGKQLRQAIEELPEQMRKCMKLRVFQDLSYQEIAVVMRISPQTVKAHLFQARRQLREKLGEYFAGVAI